MQQVSISGYSKSTSLSELISRFKIQGGVCLQKWGGQSNSAIFCACFSHESIKNLALWFEWKWSDWSPQITLVKSVHDTSFFQHLPTSSNNTPPCWYSFWKPKQIKSCHHWSIAEDHVDVIKLFTRGPAKRLIARSGAPVPPCLSTDP